VSCAPPETLLARADAARLPLPDRCVDLVFGSPPYIEARLYLEAGHNLGIARDCRAWVEWMLRVTTEAVRVSRGLVLWVCAGVTRDWCYQPGPEGLLWEWWRRGGLCWRPAYWHRVGIPGSGGRKWLRADVEYVLCFKGADNDFWTDNTAMGGPPRWAPGGAMSHRVSNGDRRNQWGQHINMTCGQRKPDGSRRRSDGTMESQSYDPPVLANPGNYLTPNFSELEAAWHERAVVHTKTGSGRLGSDLAHENEAPFPEDLAEFFVRSFCPPEGIVLDPFSGSGTTCAVAAKHDRRGIGLDLRMSQCELGRRRIADGLRPVSKLDGAKAYTPLAGQRSLFD
jgi:hypothetical protein